MLNVLPPSSDNDSWSPSSSPLPPRRRVWDLNSKKRRARAQDEGDSRGGAKKNQGTKGRSCSPVCVEGEGLVEEEVGNSASFLLPPSRCSSPSSRRSRWSLRSFLARDSDCESCRSVRENSWKKSKWCKDTDIRAWCVSVYDDVELTEWAFRVRVISCDVIKDQWESADVSLYFLFIFWPWGCILLSGWTSNVRFEWHEALRVCVMWNYSSALG